MTDFVNLDTSKAVFITADSARQAKITNITNTTLYYDDTSAASVGTNDGNLTQGQSAIFSSGVWVRPAANAQILVQYLEGVTAEDLTLTDDLSVTGTATLTGGLTTGSSPTHITSVPIGSVAYGSFGTDTAHASNKAVYVTTIFVPCNKTLTGAAKLNGTAHTDKLCYYLFNAAGTKVAQTAAAGTASATNDVFQEIAFTATYAAVGPALYHVGVQANGTTAKTRTVAAATGLVFTDIATGTSFGAETAITPPTTFTANEAPIAYLY